VTLAIAVKMSASEKNLSLEKECNKSEGSKEGIAPGFTMPE